MGTTKLSSRPSLPPATPSPSASIRHKPHHRCVRRKETALWPGWLPRLQDATGLYAMIDSHSCLESDVASLRLPSAIVVQLTVLCRACSQESLTGEPPISWALPGGHDTSSLCLAGTQWGHTVPYLYFATKLGCLPARVHCRLSKRILNLSYGWSRRVVLENEQRLREGTCKAGSLSKSYQAVIEPQEGSLCVPCGFKLRCIDDVAVCGTAGFGRASRRLSWNDMDTETRLALIWGSCLRALATCCSLASNPD
jgi:hypothetical protein